ncbi:COG1361 S-layer family protein [Halorientalis persicus]|uniref:COG1361 S-layer family protein n=1 Tax=Halorientalis persicus TaxID=1367881 RepID=UPI000B827F8A|nr:CARDB domain-containing protein [Halorientalis persicus]
MIGEPDISISSTVEEFSPGTSSQFRLSLTNRGKIKRAGPSRYQSRVTTARGVTIEIKDGNTLFDVSTGTVTAGNVPTGTVQTDPISITVPEKVDPGTYTIPVEYEYDYTRIVSYDSTGAEYNDFTESVSGSITIRVRNQAQFEVVEQETTAQIGDTSDISLTLENTGTRPASDASVSASSRSDELTFGTGSGSSTAYAGSTWEPNERKTVNYSVALADDATQRAYTLNLNVDYTDTDGIDQTSRTLKAGVPTVSAQEFDVENVESTLRVAREGGLEATIVNQGPQTISAPIATLRSNNQNLNINNPEFALPDLAPGEQAHVNYTVDVSSAADAAVQQFNFEIAYDNQNGERRTSDLIPANARIKQQQDQFIVEPVNQTAIAGEETTLELRVTNNGEKPLRSIEGKAFLDDPLSSSDDEVFIDRLGPGETTNVSVALSVGSGALEKTYPFSIDFQYEMPDGDTEVSKTYNVPIQVEQIEEDGGLPLPLIGGVAVLVFGAGIVWYTRRE